MPANTQPIFTLTPRADVAQVTTANTARDGSGTPVTICTAGANGTRIDLVRICATGTTTAGVVRLFIHNGTSAFLYDEILVSAITPSTTVAVFEADYRPAEPIVLPTGYSLRATTHNTETFNILVHGGDY